MRAALFIGFLLEAGYLLFALQNKEVFHAESFFLLYAALFGGMIFAWKKMRFSPLLVIGFAVLFRLTLLPIVPNLSDDIYRYGWEGRIQRHGFNPSQHAPESPALVPFRDAAYERINHKSIPTVYPILSQWVFRAGSHLTDALRWAGTPRWLSPDTWVIWTHVVGQKFLFVLFDLLTLWAVWRILKLRVMEDRHLLLYAWNPLVIIEIAGSGHLDSLGISLLMLGILAWMKRKPVWAIAAIVAGILSKFAGLLLFPWSFGAKEFLSHWEFNGSLYWLSSVLAGHNGLAARGIVAALGLCGAAWILSRKMPLHKTVFALLSVALLLSPVVHPWYVLWLVPFLCLFQSPAFLTWNATVVLSYAVLTRYRLSGIWELSPMIQGIEYVPVYAGMAWEMRRRVNGGLK